MQPLSLMAQAYGGDTYNSQTFSCADSDTACIEAAQAQSQPTPTPTTNSNTPGDTQTHTGTVGTPNTGVFGMPADVATAAFIGLTSFIIAIVGIAGVLTARRRARL